MMKPITRYAVMAVAIALVAVYAIAQEVVPTPVPTGTAKVGANVGANESDQSASTPAANATAQQDANRWRYRWSNGRWWYWTPQNRWMWYSDDGRWIEQDPNANLTAAGNPTSGEGSASGGDYGYRGYSPRYGYWGGYSPGVAVWVRPYGNIDVGVGQRIGVGVCGPHGSVHVGRFFVAW